MNHYKIYCTVEQTKKAFELGAPIERGHEGSRYFNIGVPTYYDENDEVCRVKNSVIFIPTAEEMIGWLEKNYYLSFDIYQPRLSWSCSVKYKDKECVFIDSLDSRKEATISAIDAALEYLSNNKK